MAQPSISVLMPAYKAEATIMRAAKSVLDQDWPNIELVIASDDGEDYIAVLANHGLSDDRIRQVHTGGTGTGDWNARNSALAAANGDLVTLIDSDDEYAPGRLSALAPIANANGAAIDNTQLFLNDVVVTTLLHEDEKRESETVEATAPLILRDRTPVFPMWRRRDFSIGWHKLPHASDVIFSLELLSAAPQMRVISHGGYRYYKRPGSMTLSDTMTERSRTAYYSIIASITAGNYALTPKIADFALYEIAKNLNQAKSFGQLLAKDPNLTHEMLAIRFNQRAMIESERIAFFEGELEL